MKRRASLQALRFIGLFAALTAVGGAITFTVAEHPF